MVNVNCGGSPSGKSTIFHSILLASGINEKLLKQKKGKITLKLFSNQTEVTVYPGKLEQDIACGYGCLIGDDFQKSVPTDIIPEVYQELSKLRMQTIITAEYVDRSRLPENVNVLSLSGF